MNVNTLSAEDMALLESFEKAPVPAEPVRPATQYEEVKYVVNYYEHKGWDVNNLTVDFILDAPRRKAWVDVVFQQSHDEWVALYGKG